MLALLLALFAARAQAASLPSEPSPCAFASAAFEPRAAVKDVDCALAWLIRSREYVKAAGKPGPVASEAQAARHVKESLARLSELEAWLAAYDSGAPKSRFDAKSRRRAKAVRGEPKAGDLDFKDAVASPRRALALSSAALAVPLAAALSPALAPMASADIEMAGCAFYAGGGEPSYAVSELRCVVEWLVGAKERFQGGGKPTEWTNRASALDYRRQARKRVAELHTWFKQVKLTELLTPMELAEKRRQDREAALKPAKTSELDFGGSNPKP